MSQTSNHYTFGENHLAAQRLACLAEAYEHPSREFIGAWASAPVEHAIDLGCGPGYTTRLLHSVLRARRTTGIDASETLLMQARLNAPDAAFIAHDITRAPFPCEPADLLLCRFVVTHLHDPASALRAWSQAAKPGARLLVQETASLESDDPILRRYYELVAALQSGYGQSLTVGAHLDGCVAGSGWTVVSSELNVVEQAPHVMARLHAMNIRTWSSDTLARGSFDPEEIAMVQSELDRIASGERKAGPVRNALRQLVATRHLEPSL